MPTLLRCILVLLTSGVLFAGIALLALAEVIGTPDGTRLALGSLAVCALALPPMLAGVFASYWSWDAAARGRLRVSVAVLVLVQLGGAGGLIALTIARGALLLPVVVLVVVAAALDPATVAIGRAARRVELQREPPAGDFEDLRSRIRLGWRRGGIGAGIGISVGILICVALLLPLAGEGETPRALIVVPAGAGLGASIGMLTVVLGLAGRIRDLLGGDHSSARRIGRAVSGKPEQLTEPERARASRYAAIAPEWLRLQSTQSLVNALAVTAIATFSLLGPASDHLPGLGWIAGFLIAGLVVSIGAAMHLRVVRLRRVRAYAAAHPLLR